MLKDTKRSRNFEEMRDKHPRFFYFLVHDVVFSYWTVYFSSPLCTCIMWLSTNKGNGLLELGRSSKQRCRERCAQMVSPTKRDVWTWAEWESSLLVNRWLHIYCNYCYLYPKIARAYILDPFKTLLDISNDCCLFFAISSINGSCCDLKTGNTR